MLGTGDAGVWRIERGPDSFGLDGIVVAVVGVDAVTKVSGVSLLVCK